MPSLMSAKFFHSVTITNELITKADRMNDVPRSSVARKEKLRATQRSLKKTLASADGKKDSDKKYLRVLCMSGGRSADLGHPRRSASNTLSVEEVEAISCLDC